MPLLNHLDTPFKQLVYILFKLREAEKYHAEHHGYAALAKVKEWRAKADKALASMGVNKDTDFRNAEIKIVSHETNAADHNS